MEQIFSQESLSSLKIFPENSDIKTLLENYFFEELMDGSDKIYCNRCNQKQDMIVSTTITKPPEVLNICLNRYLLPELLEIPVTPSTTLEFGDCQYTLKYHFTLWTKLERWTLQIIPLQWKLD